MNNIEDKIRCSYLYIIEDDSSVKNFVDYIIKNNPEASTLYVVSSCLNKFSPKYPKMSLTDWRSIVTTYLDKKTQINNNIECPPRKISFHNLDQYLLSKSNNKIHSYLEKYNYPQLSEKYTRKLIDRYRKGDRRACDLLLNGNFTFIFSIACNHLHKGVELDDLIQEGSIGLLKALKYFDIDHNDGFIKYAYWWISQSIMSAIANQSNLIRIPINTVELHRKILKSKEQYEQLYEYYLPNEEFKIDEELSKSQIFTLRHMPDNLRDIVCPCENYDIFISDINPIIDFEERDFNSYYVRQLLNILDLRERCIVRLYYGIDTCSMSLYYIADFVGLTRERVRQILVRSVEKIKDYVKGKSSFFDVGDKVYLTGSDQIGKIKSIRRGLCGDKIYCIDTGRGLLIEVGINDISNKIGSSEKNKTDIEKENELVKKIERRYINNNDEKHFNNSKFKKYSSYQISNIQNERKSSEVDSQSDKIKRKNTFPKQENVHENNRKNDTRNKIDSNDIKYYELYFSQYTNRIMNIRQVSAHGKVVLAKPVLLVSIIDAIDSRVFLENRFWLNDWLESRYKKLMAKYAQLLQGDVTTDIEEPFWHLQKDGFWHLNLRTEALSANHTPFKTWIHENVKFAKFDENLWFMLKEKEWRKNLREYIIKRKLQDI